MLTWVESLDFSSSRIRMLKMAEIISPPRKGHRQARHARHLVDMGVPTWHFECYKTKWRQGRMRWAILKSLWPILIQTSSHDPRPFQ